MWISLFIQQHGLAGLPLFRNLAFRQITKEPRQGVDEYWRKALQVFWSYSVRPGAVRFLTDMIACRISDGRTSGMTCPSSPDGEEARDMAVEEIRVEVVDDFLHPPSRCNGCSLWVPESSHPRLAPGEVSTGIADAFPRLCSFSQHFCSSLLRSSLSPLGKAFELGREFLVPCGSCCSTLAYQLKSFKRQASPGGFKTLSLLRAVVKVFDKPVIFLVDVVHCRIFPKAGQRSEEIPVDGSPGISL
ncbi:hypothetical protein RB195_010647 [Necator americanus]|uniref:Uncharacterized protein n=1 Tax=Necator americanus TaxID=51031 RepID=A0ABR1D064_NECAM